MFVQSFSLWLARWWESLIAFENPSWPLKFRFTEAPGADQWTNSLPLRNLHLLSQGGCDLFSLQMLDGGAFYHLTFHSSSSNRTQWWESVLCHYLLDPFVSSRRSAASNVTPNRHFTAFISCPQLTSCDPLSSSSAHSVLVLQEHVILEQHLL